MDNSEGRLVAGRYRLLSPLGSGGMGTVWRAQDEVLGRGVAVKEVVFPRGLSAQDCDVLRERTRREARAAARLDHPSAVTVFDVVEEEGSPFLVMELVEARPLSQVVRSDGPLTPAATARVGLALLGALELAHRHGIVHRDVKPGNVLLGGGADDTGRVVLTDFGIASSVGDSSITSTGLLLGSPSYIAPERARGLPPEPASDLWSLGATLFTAVEGRPPYDGGDPLTTVTAVVTGEHAPFERAGPLQDVLEGLLEREPSRRLTAVAARRMLERVAAEQDPSPTVSLRVPPSRDALVSAAQRTSALPVAEVRAAAAAAAPAAKPAPSQPAWDRPPPVARRRRRSRSRALLAGLVLLPAASVVALVVVLDPGSGGRPGGQPAEQGSSPSAAASADPGTALPDGWTLLEAEQGWGIGVPPGYVRSTYRGSQVQLRDPAARRTLRVDVQATADGGAEQALARLSPSLGGQLAGYQELRLEAADYRGLDAADLEFTYVDQTELRVLDRAVVAQDGRTYYLYWQVRATDWEQALPVFEQLLETFAPAG